MELYKKILISLVTEDLTLWREMNALSPIILFPMHSFFSANNVWSSHRARVSADCVIDRLGEAQIWPFLHLYDVEEKEFASRNSLLLQMEIVRSM